MTRPSASPGRAGPPGRTGALLGAVRRAVAAVATVSGGRSATAAGRPVGGPLRRAVRSAAGPAAGLLLPGLLALLLGADAVRAALGPVSETLLFLLTVVAVGRVGGVVPAVLASVTASLLLNYWFVPPVGRFTLDARALVALAVFTVTATTVAAVAARPSRRSRPPVRAAPEDVTLRSADPADRTRTALLRAVGHDLRTPLTAGWAAVASLRSRDVELSADDREELLATADAALARLSALVENLLDLGQLQAGALTPRPRATALTEVVVPALAALPPGGPAVEVHGLERMPEVFADPPLLARALTQLVANAVRHSPPPHPVLLTASAPADRVELRVADRGPGLPAAARERVFEPFQRLGDTDNTSGLGLGLALSRGLTEAMGGTLTPEDTPGGGLTMVLSLPVAGPVGPAAPVPS